MPCHVPASTFSHPRPSPRSNSANGRARSPNGSAAENANAVGSWEEPAGGASVAAVQLAKLAGGADFFTALGDDDLGHRVPGDLERYGVHVHAAFRDAPQRRA